MISGQFGVGYYTWEAYSLVSYPEIGLGMITIGLLGLIFSVAFDWVERLAIAGDAGLLRYRMERRMLGDLRRVLDSTRERESWEDSHPEKAQRAAA